MNSNYIYFIDTTLKRRISSTYLTHSLYYYSGNIFIFNKCSFSSSYYYDENSTRINYSDIGLDMSADWLFKVNIIKNNVKIREDYIFIRNTGDSDTKVERSVYKLQNEDGSYSYCTGLCELTDGSQFPTDKSIDHEFTFDITNV